MNLIDRYGAFFGLPCAHLLSQCPIVNPPDAAKVFGKQRLLRFRWVESIFERPKHRCYIHQMFKRPCKVLKKRRPPRCAL